ncbi:protein of unknown function [Pseudodesulfovibrio profundus]|uniref:Uncharacterized protein n=1 Tax=Pseudodesulfovibrio profundus TaxID=57320 RepID=A0A2C8F465_9BACT|nr:protein of unknown function [Pseudodesulfovibrio profundus]
MDSYQRLHLPFRQADTASLRRLQAGNCSVDHLVFVGFFIFFHFSLAKLKETFYTHFRFGENICGEVAQLVRACGSYPQSRRFKSSPRYHD